MERRDGDRIAAGNGTVSEQQADRYAARIGLELWQSRWLVFGLASSGGLLAFVYSLLATPIYTATVTILPQVDSSGTGLIGSLSSIVGAPIITDASYEQIYGNILESDQILDQVISRRWQHGSAADSLSMYEIFEIDAHGDTPSRAQARLKRKLRNDVIRFSQNKRTGYMTLEVHAPGDPRFAASLANALVNQLGNFNLSLRGKKAEEKHAFLQRRLVEVERELRAAGDSLVEFEIANRSYRESPVLSQQHDELEREIQAQTSIWVELRRQFELARLEMSKENTSVDVLDRATPPIEPSSPDRFLYTATGLFLGLALAALIILVSLQVRAVQSIARMQQADSTART